MKLESHSLKHKNELRDIEFDTFKMFFELLLPKWYDSVGVIIKFCSKDQLLRMILLQKLNGVIFGKICIKVFLLK